MNQLDMLKIETNMTRSSMERAFSIEDAPSGSEQSDVPIFPSKCGLDDTTSSVHGLCVMKKGIFSEANAPTKIDEVGYPTKEVIFVNTSPGLLQKLAEKDEKIKELIAKLNKFERACAFEFDSFDLPDDYYENDAYSDR